MKEIIKNPKVEAVKEAMRMFYADAIGFVTSVGLVMGVEFSQDFLNAYLIHLDSQEKTIVVIGATLAIKYFVRALDKFKHEKGKLKEVTEKKARPMSLGKSYGFLP